MYKQQYGEKGRINKNSNPDRSLNESRKAVEKVRIPNTLKCIFSEYAKCYYV